jgi:hypothetical protein
MGDTMHRANPVGDHRDPPPLATAVAQLRFLGAEEGSRRRVWHGGYERLEEAGDDPGEVAAGDSLGAAVDRLAQPAVMPATSAPVEINMGEPISLQIGDQVPPAKVEPNSVQPGLQQRPSVLRPHISSNLPLPGSPLPDHPFGHLQDSGRIRTGNSARGDGGEALAGPSPLLSAEGLPSVPHHKRPRRQRHRGMRPLSGAALFPLRFGVAPQHVGKKLFRRRGRGHLGEGAADVDAGMVVGTADAGAAVGLDVDGGRHVQLGGPRTVADLPDREELRQSPPVAPGQGRGDVEEGMRQGTGDPIVVKICGAGFDVAGMRLQPLVVSGGDPVTEDVNRLGLAGEAGGQLLGDEAVGTVGQLEAAVDRVVVGDRDEVHPPPLRQLVDLLGRRRALRQPQRTLDTQLRKMRRGRMAMHVNAGSHRCSPSLNLCCQQQSSLRGSERCEKAENGGESDRARASVGVLEHHTRNLIRFLTCLALAAALSVAAAAPIPEDLPAVALGQVAVYRLEIALLAFYGALLLITPAVSGLFRGQLPVEITTRGAKFADETNESADAARRAIERLEQITCDLGDGLRAANIQIEKMKEGP